MNQAQALYQLQNIDLSISEYKARLAEIERLLAEHTRVPAAEQTLHQAEEALTSSRVRVRDLELELKGLASKSAATEETLYSGRVTNPKELQDLQEEVASLRRRHNRLEDSLLEAMIETESAQERFQQAAADLAEARAEADASRQALTAEFEQIQQALEPLRQQRSELLRLIDAANLELYKKLYSNKHGQAVAPVEDGACRACGVSQTSATVQLVRQGYKLVRCNNCGRILVMP
ncbi:MAG: hypothetical protein HPY64_12445 [Anaerolineae bacterium]|nr:hypothetical protein [Anaerolineae bacterium]